MRRARRLLRLAQEVRDGALRLSRLSRWAFGCGDGTRGALFHDAMERLIDLHGEIRERARRELLKPKTPLAFGYAPREKAYPRWRLSSERERELEGAR